jgi:G3E family GTPase
MAEITPITLVIGLPGAGKTTLLRDLLRRPGMADIALVAAPPDPPMWWGGGCPCCAPRDDVARALRALLPRVRRDEVRRVVIETSGMADPGPILATLLSDTVAASAYRLDAIVTVIDAVNGAAALDAEATLDAQAPRDAHATRDAQAIVDARASLDAQERAVRQVAVADRIVLSKTDLADGAGLRARLRLLNPGAPVVPAPLGAIDPAAVLGAGLTAASGSATGLRAWLNPQAFDAADRAASPGDDASPHRSARDAAGINTFCLSYGQKLRWPEIMQRLERLILTHGNAVLRMKAILHLQGREQPLAIHSMGHLLHPPITLAACQDGDPRASHLMFVTRDLARSTVEAALPAFAAVSPG